MPMSAWINVLNYLNIGGMMMARLSIARIQDALNALSALGYSDLEIDVGLQVIMQALYHGADPDVMKTNLLSKGLEDSRARLLLADIIRVMEEATK